MNNKESDRCKTSEGNIITSAGVEKASVGDDKCGSGEDNDKVTGK